jgi:hypothetical protein
MTMTGGRQAVARGLGAALACLLAVTACSGGGDRGDRGAVAGDDAGAPEVTDTELAAQAYVAGYPLVVSIRTLQRLGGLIGVNRLLWQNSLAGPQSRIIVAPNRDTLYSVAVLDLRSEPMVLTLPRVDDRYYTYQFLDAWTESFAYIGTRATHGRAGTWVITPPGWDGELPVGADQIAASTPQVFLLGRFLVYDEADIANVTTISEQSSLRPLSALTGDPPVPPPPPLGEPAGTPQAIPTDARFFDELGDALAVNPPTTPTQRELFAQAQGLGIGPGEHPAADATDADRGPSDDRAGSGGDGTLGADLVPVLDAGAALGFERIVDELDGFGETTNGWSTNLHIGRYGDETLLRAVVARVGWGANVADEAVYPVARVDADGAPLDGTATYRITFPAGDLPPVDAFWSLSVYGSDMFFAEHPSGRYTVGDRTPGLSYGADGSLEIVLSHDEPTPASSGGAPVNWLPVPAGEFVLMLRLYLPRQQVLDGDYAYPPVERLDAAT